MNYVRFNVEELIASNENVRDGHTAEDVKAMASSIKSHGIINAPCVADSAAGWTIVAGKLRVAGAKYLGMETIMCQNVSDLDEAGRLELSLSENVDRVRMTPLQVFYAMSRLFKAGRSIEQLAGTFSKTPVEINQTLAIGNLPKEFLILAEQSEMSDKALQAFATAGIDHAKKYVALPEKNRPMNHQVTEWIRGREGWYNASVALFPIEKYTGVMATDFFSGDGKGEQICIDGGMFMTLQDEAVKEAIDGFVSKGYKVTQVDYWQTHMYKKAAKKLGGQVFYTRDPDCAVKFHIGYQRIEKAGKAPATTAKGKEKDKKEKKPEVSQAFIAYITQHRHNAVRSAVMEDTTAALVLNICLMLSEHDNWRIDDQRHTKLTKECEQDVRDSADYTHLNEAYLKISKDKNPAELIKLSIDELLRRLEIITAWKWQTVDSTTGSFSNQMAKAMALKTNEWKPTATFWSSIKSKATLEALAKECKVSISSDMKIDGIQKLLTDKVKPSDWRPKWLRF